MAQRPSAGGILARIVFVAAIATQLFFIVRGYSDPHKHFAFQPFNESDQWRADIVRVTWDGRRIPVREDWFGYRWSSLVRASKLDTPERWHHAKSGIRSTLRFLDEALDWVADHTPADNQTRHYEARVEYRHNRRAPSKVLLVSKQRPPLP